VRKREKSSEMSCRWHEERNFSFFVVGPCSRESASVRAVATWLSIWQSSGFSVCSFANRHYVLCSDDYRLVMRASES